MKPTNDDSLYRFSKLFPRLPEDQLQKVKGVLENYAATCWKIYQRMEKDPEAMAKVRADIAEKRKQQNQGL